MKATTAWTAALALVLAAAPLAHAGWSVPCCPLVRPCVPQAPDACGPGYYSTNAAGGVYGPNYLLHPPYLPYNGMVLGPGGAGGAGAAGNGPIGFPTHPYARSPRDFFMMDP
jgi:hypothetical protein